MQIKRTGVREDSGEISVYVTSSELEGLHNQSSLWDFITGYSSFEWK
jgi:hypothetical protein